MFQFELVKALARIGEGDDGIRKFILENLHLVPSFDDQGAAILTAHLAGNDPDLRAQVKDALAQRPVNCNWRAHLDQALRSAHAAAAGVP